MSTNDQTLYGYENRQFSWYNESFPNYNSLGILTDLAWIQEGAKFPPPDQMNRLVMYDINNHRYIGDYNRGKYLHVMTEEGEVVIPLQVFSTRLYKIITDKLIGLLLNQKPMLSHTDDVTTKQINDKVENVNYWYKVTQLAKSVESLGDGVMHVFRNADDKGDCTWVNPENWFKIVDPQNIGSIQTQVFAQKIYTSKLVSGVIKREWTHVRFIAHYPGYYEEQVHEYKKGKLGKVVDIVLDGVTISTKPEQIETGLKDIAVFSAHNSLPINGIYGLSGYDPVEGFISDLEKYLTLYKWVVDQNGRPYKVVSMDVLQESKIDGRQRMPQSRTLAKRPDTQSPISFEAPPINHEAYKVIFDELNKGLSTGSEFGDVFLHAQFSTASGEALKTLLKGPLDKASRLIDSMEFLIKKVLCSMMELDGVAIEPSEVNITWQDGITESSKVLAETAKIRIDSGTLSRQSAVRMLDGVSKDQAVEELNIVSEETNKGGNTGG